MQDPEEYQLINNLISGEEVAFKKVFDTYYRSLVVASYQILKDEEVSKDAVQEVFFELWKNRTKLHGGIILKPYLKRSVLNRSLNILKSRRHHISSGSEPLNFEKDKSRQPDEIFQDNELKSVVMKAIDKLPDRCRAVFMLCRMEDLSHVEVARQLKISTKTIENQMTKALKTIRKEIAQYQDQMIIMVTLSFIVKWGIDHFQLLSCYHL